MKRLFLALALLFAGLFFSFQSSLANKLLPDNPSAIFKYWGESRFKFTNRGVGYDAPSNGKEDPPNNLATIQYDPEFGNRLDIMAFDVNSPPAQPLRTALLITVHMGDKELEKRAYPIISSEESGECKLKKFVGCSPYAIGIISPHKYADNFANKEYTLANSLSSVSGEVLITDFYLGQFVYGMAEGTISGYFSYDGYSLVSKKENPGSASGTFENVRVVAQKRE